MLIPDALYQSNKMILTSHFEILEMANTLTAKLKTAICFFYLSDSFICYIWAAIFNWIYVQFTISDNTEIFRILWAGNF